MVMDSVSSYQKDDSGLWRFWSTRIMDSDHQGCGSSGFICLEIGHNIEFLEFG